MLQQQGTSGTIKVLCVDDDAYLTDLLRYALTRDGYAVQVAGNGAQALKTAQIDPPDVAILDVHLPDTTGYALCKQIRTRFRIPVILLTARHTDDDMVAGFEQGADDYVTKPFSMRILSYRLRAVVRRSRMSGFAMSAAQTVYRLGSGLFDAEQNELAGEKGSAKLTPIQSKILRLLVAHEGHVLSADRIMTEVWHFDSESDLSVVKTHISNLRTKLAATIGDEQIIHTVPGTGYSIRQGPARTDELPAADLDSGSWSASATRQPGGPQPDTALPLASCL